MTYKKSDQATKSKIIDAAYKVLGEQGYDKSSMKEIAKEAGVAQGLINYYFPSKEELLFELFREETCRYCAEIEKINDIPLTEDFLKKALRIPSALVEEHPEWHRLRYELFAIGSRTPAGLKEIAESMKAGREQAMKAMERLPIDPGVNRLGLASIIVAALDGLSLQKMSDPAFDAEAAYAVLGEILFRFLKTN